ncbi:MAG: hypothetical protein V2G50_08365 [bacterium JZ-2024 1]
MGYKNERTYKAKNGIKKEKFRNVRAIKTTGGNNALELLCIEYRSTRSPSERMGKDF